MPEDYKLTDEDKSLIRYFWEEKGDITRFGSWEKVKPALRREFPEILKAWEDLNTAKRTLSRLVKKFDYDV